MRHSTLPKRVCDAADTATVPTSARCTVAEATAGAEPIASRSVVDETPYAMPSAPSISCAPKPMRPIRRSLPINPDLPDGVTSMHPADAPDLGAARRPAARACTMPAADATGRLNHPRQPAGSAAHPFRRRRADAAADPHAHPAGPHADADPRAGARPRGALDQARAHAARRPRPRDRARQEGARARHARPVRRRPARQRPPLPRQPPGPPRRPWRSGRAAPSRPR